MAIIDGNVLDMFKQAGAGTSLVQITRATVNCTTSHALYMTCPTQCWLKKKVNAVQARWVLSFRSFRYSSPSLIELKNFY